MRKYTIITDKLRVLISGLPEQAKYVGITIDRITWDDNDWEYNSGFNKHDYITEDVFIQNCEKLKLIIVKTNKNKMGNFLDEVKTLTKNHNSQKIQDIKQKIKEIAASGKSVATFMYHYYDRDVINWLKSEGFKVSETSDFRDGDFITVKW